MSEVDPVRLRDQPEQLPVAVEAPRPTGFGDLQSGFAIPVKEYDVGLPGGIFICEFDCRRPVPFNVDHRDEAILKDSLDGRPSFKILKFGHITLLQAWGQITTRPQIPASYAGKTARQPGKSPARMQP